MASYTYKFIELGEEHSLGCKCCLFKAGIDLPIPKKLSYTDIGNLAVKFSTSIFQDWTKLNAIVKRFEGTISKRWMKKSPKQRRDVLLKAWPDMVSSHRPDFLGWRKVLKNAPRSRTRPSAAYLWPYINLEDLQQPHHLLLFLNSRGRNLPDKCQAVDLQEAHIGDGWTPEGENHVMRIHGQRTSRTYGRLLPTALAQTITVSPKYGLLILEIQKGIYTFLLSCARLILYDIEEKQFFLAPHQTTPSLPSPVTNEWPSLSTHTREIPYRTQQLDLDRLKALVGGRRAAAEDHLWLLREDPGYFSQTLKEWEEHESNMVAGRLVGDAFTLFLHWDWIYRRVDGMPPFETQLECANHNTFRLAPKDEQIWMELLFVANAFASYPVVVLTSCFKTGPRVRHLYTRTQTSSLREGSWDYKPKASEAERRVDLLFSAIMQDEQRELHTLNFLVQEIQYMLDTDAEASELIDSWTVNIFSDLAMISELADRIACLWPWSFGWHIENAKHSTPFTASTAKLYNLEDEVRSGIYDAFRDETMVGVFNSLHGSFDYPVTKRRTEGNVNQMQKAEALLDDLWAKIERSVKKLTRYSILDTVKRLLLEPRELYRTPDWMPPLVLRMLRSLPLTVLSPTAPPLVHLQTTH